MNDLFENPPPGDLSDRQLLESIYTMLVHRPTTKAPLKGTGGAGKPRHEYPPQFQELWKAYPVRNGSNPKWQASQSWNARIKQSDDKPTEARMMIEGVKRYAKWCEATGKPGTDLVMQTVRFLGTGKEYQNSWICPAPPTKKSQIPRDNDEMATWAAKLDPPITPHMRESWWEFRQRVEESV